MNIIEDFDKYHPIPRELGKYNYIYASGGTKNEIHRHFIVPNEVYQSYKEKANALFYSSYANERFPFYFRKKDRINMIAPPEHSYGYKMLLLTTCTSSNLDNRNCELRNKRKIIKQFTTQELDIVEKELDEMDDETDSKALNGEDHKGSETECEDHIGSEAECEDHIGSETECEDHIGSEAECEDHIGSEAECEDHIGSEAECEDGNDSEPQSGEDDADNTPNS